MLEVSVGMPSLLIVNLKNANWEIENVSLSGIPISSVPYHNRARVLLVYAVLPDTNQVAFRLCTNSFLFQHLTNRITYDLNKISNVR